jgi:hypothetical protein
MHRPGRLAVVATVTRKWIRRLAVLVCGTDIKLVLAAVTVIIPTPAAPARAAAVAEAVAESDTVGAALAAALAAARSSPVPWVAAAAALRHAILAAGIIARCLVTIAIVVLLAVATRKPRAADKPAMAK